MGLAAGSSNRLSVCDVQQSISKLPVQFWRIKCSKFQSGSLFRSIHLPKKVEPGKVKAEIKNGLLTITAPIAEEAKTRKVNIQAA